MIWNNRLQIFRDFETDLGLPKWQHKVSSVNEQVASGGFITTRLRSIGVSETSSVLANSIYEDEVAFYDWAAMSWWQRLWHSLKNIFGGKKKRVLPEPKRPSLKEIKRVFERVVENASLLSSVAAENHGDSMQVGDLLLELAAYSKLLEQAKGNGQTAFAEKLQDACVVFLYEGVLAACGFNRFISEEMLIDFLTMHTDKKAAEAEATKTESTRTRYYSGFRLDWMKNFVRVLPPEVAHKKKLADSLLVFDNYVVFHYDPEQAASAMTKAEEEALRRDPILFGVVKGSKKLYFIADWVDEYCDLTLQEVVDKLKDANYDDSSFELRITEYRKKLGDIGEALLSSELKELDEIAAIVRTWLV